jgi:two-component system phosphate regulon sensor histidine kinase PhoR
MTQAVSPTPLPRVATIITALAAPALIALGIFWWSGWLDLAAGAVASALVVAAIAYLVHRHFSGLEVLRTRVDRLARGPAALLSPIEPVPVEIPASASGLARAISELARSSRERDDELRAHVAANEAILDAIPDPLILIDAFRRVTRANAAARSLFGESVGGRDLATVLRHPDVLEAAEESLAGREDVGTVEVDWGGPPDRHFSVRFAQLPALNGGDTDRTVLLVLRDVTPLKQAERMRADFVANVSHELRTPLSALLGFTETLRGAARDDPAARDRFLGIMHEQAQRMTRLVRDLLSLSRIEESEHTPPTERVELGRVLGSVVDTALFQAKAKGVTIEVEVAPGLPPLIGDADQLAQVFQNLIDNAVKYGKPNGKVRVIARAAETAPPRVAAASGAVRAAESPVTGWISVAIGDDGDGIPREHLPRLTERFYRVDAARSRQLGGTGLGLAIVKHILNRHRGALAIDSEPGRGSVFSAWLPITQPGPRPSA